MHYTILYISIIVEMKCLTHGRTLTLIEMMYNGNSPESSASAERRHVREMFDAAKRAMGEFRDDVTARMCEEYARRRG